ncbi:MAG TPA: glutamate--tRNA ligase [Anaerovoracaceae bacterium]|nr:glutamate--tRNA ligase [Anaerovoracaceae bacterium]
MNNAELAGLLFPHIDKSTEYYEELYPERELPREAMVTRLGPSPTGFIHLGNLYGAFVDERLAHQSGGVFFLRIEDTDEKREVAGAVETIISSLEYFGLRFDEGVTLDGETGIYGPYYQRQRKEIYQCFAKHLVEKGLAYPCFCTEDEIQMIREEQERAGENPGYYGNFAPCRVLEPDKIKKNIESEKPYVLRFRSFGNPERTFQVNDGIRGILSMPENFNDLVLLKQNGIPTYHFAHVVDDHLMRTTHVVRGDEWLSSLPIHVALFEAMEWPLPTYCHTGVLMKMENGNRRKLSKRKDPELSLDYYRSLGYHPNAIREYLLTILNSNYEEWRLENPDTPMEEFKFTIEKMSSSGTLFDLDKLNDVSKDVVARISDVDLYNFMLAWSEDYSPKLASLFKSNEDMLIRILSMDRHGEKPRKDLIYCKQIFDFISYFFDEYFTIEDSYPKETDNTDISAILETYKSGYDHNDDKSQWFNKIREIAKKLGYAAKPRDFKKNPELFKGHVGHVSTVIRIALMGRSSSPDLWEIQQIMGEERTLSRLNKALSNLT